MPKTNPFDPFQALYIDVKSSVEKLHAGLKHPDKLEALDYVLSIFRIKEVDHHLPVVTTPRIVRRTRSEARAERAKKDPLVFKQGVKQVE